MQSFPYPTLEISIRSSFNLRALKKYKTSNNLQSCKILQLFECCKFIPLRILADFNLSQASKDYKASNNRKVLFITKLVGHCKNIHIFTQSISLYTIIGYSSSSRGLTRRTIRDCSLIVHKILDDFLTQHLAVEIWMSM